MKTAIFGLCIWTLAVLFVGLEIGWRQREALPDKIVTLQRTCQPPPQFKPAWDCGATEAKSYCSTCLRRRWL